MTALTRREIEIIPVANPRDLPDLELAGDYVERLVEEADEETLHEFRNQAEAHRLYQERNKNLQYANHFARLKLLTERGLGALALADSPTRRVGESKCMSTWRVLAMGYERGVMLSTCDEVERAGRSITTTRIAGLLYRRGWTRVEAEAFRMAIEKRAEQEGVSKYELARRNGVYTTYLYRKRAASFQWPQARILADAIAMDPTTFPPCPPKRRGRQDGRPLWLVRERKRTGGKWDKAYGYFRQCVDQFKDLAPNNEPKWDEAYEHLRAIEEIIGRQMTKERYRS